MSFEKTSKKPMGLCFRISQSQSLLYCQFCHMYRTYIQRIEIALLSDPWCIQITLTVERKNTDKYKSNIYIYIHIVTNPVYALPFTHHQRSPAHHKDSHTTQTVTLYPGLHFPSSVALIAHTPECTDYTDTQLNPIRHAL